MSILRDDPSGKESGLVPLTTVPSERKVMILPRVPRLLFWSLAISSFAWAFFAPRFRDAEGSLEGGFCLPFAVGVALMILGSATAGRLKRFAFWFALALVGQAVALQLVEAGSAIRYQHYKAIDHLLTETPPLLLIYLVVQMAVVVAGLRTHWPRIRTWLGRTFKVWQLLAVGLVFFLSSATLSREIPVYVAELFLAAFVQAINLGNIVLMAWALPEETLATLKQTFERLLGRPRQEDTGEPGGMDRLAVLTAVWVTVLAAVLSFLVYERHPHVQDEVIYLYQARYFADGALTVPAPPAPDAFSLYMIPYEADRWYSIFPPGWPAMLALGVFLGVPWLVNPVLAGLNVLLTYLFVREMYDRRTARMAVLLLCISPWYVFMGMNFMAHTFTLTCALVASVGVAWARKSGKARWAWLAGGAAGTVGLIRPLDGMIVAGLLGLWVIGIGGRRLKVSSIAAFVLGAIVVGAAIFPYNKWVTGDPTVFPMTAYYEQYFGPKSNALGFGPERGLGWAIDPFPGHSPLEALINANLNIFSMNIELFGWSTGSLILVALLLFSGAMRKGDYLMLVVVAAIFAVFSFYWFSGGPDFGARYWYLMLVPLVALTVRGVQFLERTFESKPASSNVKGTWLMVAVLSLNILALVNYLPWRAIDKYHHYLGMRPDMKYLAEEYGFGKSLVLIRGSQFPDYASAWVYNPLDPYANAPVFAWDRDPQVRAQVLAAYPERSIWIVDGPSITHGAFKVVDGPLSRHDLIAEDNETR